MLLKEDSVIEESPIHIDKENLFDEYSRDIKEVRSLVNLWREEFERRLELGYELMDKAKTKDESRTCGYSESLAVKNKESVRIILFKHLDVKGGMWEEETSMFAHLPSIDFKRTLAVICIKDKPQQEGERWQQAGITNMNSY